MGKFKDLDGLLWQVMKVSRPPTPSAAPRQPEVRLGFDADRFRWLFKQPYLDVLYFIEKQVHPSLQEWRELIDKEMLSANAEHPAASKTNNEPSGGCAGSPGPSSL